MEIIEVEWVRVSSKNVDIFFGWQSGCRNGRVAGRGKVAGVANALPWHPRCKRGREGAEMAGVAGGGSEEDVFERDGWQVGTLFEFFFNYMIVIAKRFIVLNFLFFLFI